MDSLKNFLKRKGMIYLYDVKDIPRELQEGMCLVHNRVPPRRRLGTGGFRAWIQKQKLNDHLVVCSCDWAGVDLHGLVHYRSAPKRTAEVGGSDGKRT